MAALRSGLPSRLRRLLSGESAIGPSLKLDSEPASENLGMAMIYTLVTASQDWLTEKEEETEKEECMAPGGYGGIKISSRHPESLRDKQLGAHFKYRVSTNRGSSVGYGCPFPPPDGDYTILAGDWFKQNHTDLKAVLDGGHDLPFPDGLLINGRGANGYTFNVDQGKTYRFRISNVGLTTSVNFRIQGHTMKLAPSHPSNGLHIA